MSVTTMLRGTKKQDEWTTPDYAVEALLPFLPDKSKILCPFDWCDSAFVTVLKKAGHKVDWTHIEEDGVNDFFFYEKEDVKQYDFIISNPPYSKKDAVFEKLFELDRPFCMLLGASAGLFEGKRFTMWSRHEDELTTIWLSPRIAYIDKNGAVQKSPPFQSCYVCWRLSTRGHWFIRIEK